MGTTAAALENALKRHLRGDVRFDRLARTIYSTDASIYEITPIGVVMPRDLDDVVATVRICADHGASVVPRGAGTGIAGGAVGPGVQIDFSRYMHRIELIDPDARLATVQPGVVLDDLNAACAPHGLHFAPDVATASRATIGGMIANNSAGSHSVWFGRTVDHLAELTVVLADGSVQSWPHLPFDPLPPDDRGRVAQRPAGLPERPHPRSAGCVRTDPPAGSLAARIEAKLDRLRHELRDEVFRRYPRVLRSNGGYALDRLCTSAGPNPATILCGSEGTLGLIVGAKLWLTPLPKHKALVVLHFDRVLDAVAATPALLEHDPAAVELVDRLILEAGAPQVPARLRERFLVGLPEAILICELYDDHADALAQRMKALETDIRRRDLARTHRVVFDPAVQAEVWNMRNRGFGLLMSRPGQRQPYEFIEDAAVDPSDLADYIGQLDAMLADEGVTEVGHYAHASVGVIHVRPVLNLRERADVQRMARIARRTAELVRRFGGAMTGEHGDGLLRSQWHEILYGPRIVEAFREIKRTFDPAGVLNPGHVVDSPPMHENLRYGEGYATLPVQTHFDYSRHGGMAALAGMCSGVGQCRQKRVGTMCPSYMATLDETHTTRARANALRVALSNRGLLDGLADPALDEVMDLCLLCKACKTECPTGVDMARLKSEWLAHRNARLGVPRSARFIADAARHARIGSRFPRLVNALLRRRWVRRLLERRYGIDARAPLPALAERTGWQLLHATKRRRERHEGTEARRAQGTGRRAQGYGGQTPSSGHAERPALQSDPASGTAGRGCPPQQGTEARRNEGTKGREQGTGHAPQHRPQKGDERRGGSDFALRSSNFDLQPCPTHFRHSSFDTRHSAKRVLYLVDTWTNHYWPQVGVAAVRLLEAAGFEVVLPKLACCGRPQFSKGLLDEARKLAEHNVAALDALLDDRTWIAGSEPGCTLTLRDEYPLLLASDAARRVADRVRLVDQLLAELLEQRPDAIRWRTDAPPQKVLVHAHCHQKALTGTQATLALLRAIPGLEVEEIHSGCCGMAGSFGHEVGHYEIARAIGEQRLFPAVRSRGDAVIAVTGFSCREQIAHHTDATPRHVLEIAAQRLAEG